MKKLLILLLCLCLTTFTIFNLTGCSFLEDALNTTLLEEENNNLKAENKELKQQLFDLKYPNGIINESIELNVIERSIVEGEGDAIQVIGGAQVTINGGKFDGGQTPLGGAGNTAIWCNSEDAKVIINGGIFTIKGLAAGDIGHIDLIYCTAGIIEINGGYFEGADNTVWLLNCKDANYQEGKAQIIVKGGTFLNFDPSNCVSEGENTNFVAEGYKVIAQVINQGQENEYTLYKIVEGVPEIEEPEAPGAY